MKKKTTSQLKRELDKLFSEWVRRSNADKNGVCTCYCGTRSHWSLMQNSHYISRSCLALRYDERNVFPACVSCNIFKSGNLPAYSIFLEEKFGQGIIQQLVKESRAITKNFPYQEKIDFYKKALASFVL